MKRHSIGVSTRFMVLAMVFATLLILVFGSIAFTATPSQTLPVCLSAAPPIQMVQVDHPARVAVTIR